MATRMSADARREQLVRAAVEQFAAGGYIGTSTEAIAASVGISQAYLFRLFKTKRDLFLACSTACHDAVLAALEASARDLPVDERLPAMGRAYMQLLQDRRLLLFQMQQYAACADPVIQAHVRSGYLDLFAAVAELSGAAPEAVWEFFGQGMLLNVVASLDLPASEARFMPAYKD